jgi:hypothetical protein
MVEKNWKDNYIVNIPICQNNIQIIINSPKDQNNIETTDSFFCDLSEEIKITEKKYRENLNYINLMISQKKNFNKHSSLEILENEELISEFLCKYVLQNNFLNKKFFINSLQLIYDLSFILGERLGLKVIKHKQNKKIKSISRCSYKFCCYRENCIYNYEKNKSACHADHYVHNRICADIDSLILFIEYNYKNVETFNHNKEIMKCINTIYYVIKHMKVELKNLCLYCDKSEWEQKHFIKKIND